MSIDLYTKNGLHCSVPQNDSEDSTPKFIIPDQELDAYEYYKKNGYVVLKKIISKNNCNCLINYWNEEVKPFKGYLYIL